MPRKEDTPLRNARRSYEERNKEERLKATTQFNTRLPKEKYDEINEFLEKHNIRKIDLIYAGYEALKETCRNLSNDTKQLDLGEMKSPFIDQLQLRLLQKATIWKTSKRWKRIVEYTKKYTFPQYLKGGKRILKKVK